MEMRPLQEHDLEVVRQLRNANRAAFFHSDVISVEEQRRWYTRLQALPLRFFVIEEDDHVIGTISISASGSPKEIGNIIIDEAYRRRGLMRRAIEELTADAGDYICRVRPENEASLITLSRSGFVPAYVTLVKTTAGTPPVEP